MRFPGFLRDGFVPSSRHHPFGGFLLIRMKCGLVMGHPRHIGPELLGTVATAMANVTRNALPGLASMAIQLRGFWAFFYTQRHSSSAAASNWWCLTTSVGCAGGWTGK
jgi:hypothetical protein